MRRSTPPPLSASVVGGGTGGRLSLRALADSPLFDLVAVADLRPEVRRDLAAEYPGIETYPTHEAMFAARPTDVVCVSTYPPSHEPIALDALRLPLRGILVEKPLGHTAASGRRILEAVKARGLPMAVPHGLLAKRAPLEILERVRRGEIGELRLVEVQCSGWDIINAGIHWLNYFVTLTNNEPLAHVLACCDASTRTYRDGMQVETIAVTYAQTMSGVRVVMITGDEVRVNADGKQFLFQLVGTLGTIEFYGWDPSYRVLNAAFPNGRMFTPDEFAVSGHRRHLETMAAMVYNNEPDYTIPESSLLALEICEGAYLSSKHTCAVTFPVDEFVPPPRPQWQPGEPYSGTGGGRDGRKL